MIKSLLYKNFLMFCETIKYTAIIIAIYWIVAFVSAFNIDNPEEIWIFTTGATVITALILFFVMDSIIEKDKKSGWNKYALTTEISVSKLLFTQYIFAFLITFAMSSICFIFTLICFLINSQPITSGIVFLDFTIMSMVLVSFSFDIPLSYKFSSFVASIIKLSAFSILTIFIVAYHINGSVLSSVFELMSDNWDLVKIILFIFPFAFYVLSWLIFRKIRILV